MIAYKIARRIIEALEAHVKFGGGTIEDFDTIGIMNIGQNQDILELTMWLSDRPTHIHYITHAIKEDAPQNGFDLSDRRSAWRFSKFLKLLLCSLKRQIQLSQ